MHHVWCSLLVLFLTSGVQAASFKFVNPDVVLFNYERDGVAFDPAVANVRHYIGAQTVYDDITLVVVKRKHPTAT